MRGANGATMADQNLDSDTATNAGGEGLAPRVAGAIAGGPLRRALLVHGLTRSSRPTPDAWGALTSLLLRALGTAGRKST